MVVEQRSVVKLQPKRARKRSPRWPLPCVAFLFTVALLPSTAFAQTAQTASEIHLKARGRYLEGARAYSEARYEDAISHFEAAYALEPAGALLLNIAQANRLKTPANCQAALRHYELYLAAEPRAPERAEVEGNKERMRQCLADAAKVAETPRDQPKPAAPAPAVATSSTTSSSTTPMTTSSSTTPIWIGAAGAAVFIGGGALYTAAQLRFNALQRECPPCSDDSIDRWQMLTNVSYVSMAVGSLTAATALVWWSRRWSGTEERPRAAVPSFTAAPTAWISGRNMGVAWQGQF